MVVGSVNWWHSAAVTTKFIAGFEATAGRFVPHSPIVGAMSAADVLAWTQTGRLPSWCEIGIGSAVNLLPNSSFTLDPTVAANGGWSLDAGISWNSGAARIDFATGGGAFLRGSTSSTDVWSPSLTGRRPQAFEVVFTISNYVSGSLLLTDSGGTALTQTSGTAVPASSANGTYRFQVTNASTRFMFGSFGAMNFSVDDIQIRTVGPVFRPMIRSSRILSDTGGNRIHGVMTTGVYPLTDEYRGNVMQTGITANGEFVDTVGCVPPDAVIESVVVRNTTGNAVTGFAIGSSSGGSQICPATNVPANSTVVLALSQPLASALTAGSYYGQLSAMFGRLYYSASSWNSGSLNVSIRFRRERGI